MDRSHPEIAYRWIWPTYGPQSTVDGLRNRSLCMQETVTQDYVTGYDLRKRVAGDGFEPS